MPPRLVPQPDGFADYIDPSQGPGQYSPAHAQPGRRPEAGRGDYSGRRRKNPQNGAARQRSIRSTITTLLVLPLLSLIVLWAYAASSTVGGAVAKRNADAVNKTVGAQIAALIQQLDAERGETFIWQSARGRLPRTALNAQREHTRAAIVAFRAGAAAAAGVEPAAAQSAAATLLAKLTQLASMQTEVNGGTISPPTAFQGYNAMLAAVDSYISALTNPNESLASYQQGQAAFEDGEALDAISQEAALVGGAFASGGSMSGATHRLFVQTVDNQRFFEQLGTSPIDWQESPDPYLRVLSSPTFASFQALENKIANHPGRLPVTLAAWRAGVKSAFTGFGAADSAVLQNGTRGQARQGDVILLRLILVGGAGLLAVITSSILLLRFGNRISRELVGLRNAARTLADERLPSVVSRLRAGDEVDVAAEAPPLALATKTREVTETADAFSAMQRTAVEAAVEQAQLRKGVSLVFRSLSRRNQSLLQRQLKLLDEMERGTEDPDALEQLFRLDHLTTRMRRQAEGLIILSGAAPGRSWRQPVPVVEVLRGAVGEIEDFARVDLVADSPDFMQGTAVADVTHLLAELVENAVQYSPPGTRVQVRGGRVANGYVIDIEDRGLGIPADTMSVLNERLATPPEFDLADTDQLGLFVVSRLAARHGVKVLLRVSGYGGTTAIVLLPRTLVVAEEEVRFLVAKSATDASAGTGRAMAAGAASGAAAEALAALRLRRPERALGSANSAGGPAAAGSVQALPSRRSPDAGIPARRAGRQGAQPVAAGPAGASGLPHRQAGASIAPQLREGRPGSHAGPPPRPSAEQTRAVMSAIQQGWRSGRDANTSEDGGRPGEESPGTGPGRNDR